MADEFQAGVINGGNWWSSSRSLLLGSSPSCSSMIHDVGSFGWPAGGLGVMSDFLDMKGTTTTNSCCRSSTDDSAGSGTSDGSIVLQNPNHQEDPISIDSTLQMMGIGFSSSSSSASDHWNQAAATALLHHGNERSEQSNYASILQQEDLNSGMNYRQETGVACPQIQTNNIGSFRPTGPNQEFASTECTATSFPVSSASYGYSSALLQTLFDTDPENQQSSNSVLANYRATLNEISPPNHNMMFSNKAPFWNASAAALNDVRPSFLPSTQAQFNGKTNLPTLTPKTSINENGGESGSSTAKKTSSEPAFKRPRIETPSPLPTFKVRKEKLGDRITALQQLVSPFGKTDTASVLHEAIEYIKFLHDQVSVLSTPYMKNGPPAQRQLQAGENLVIKDQEGFKQDLKSRGLCLVPISSTFPVAAETTTDFWTPTFGGSFR